MKTILFVIAAMFAMNANAAPRLTPQPTEHPSGCFWKEDGGRCMVFNTTVKTLKCDVYSKITVKDHKGERTHTGSKKIEVMPKMDAEIHMQPEPGQKVERMEIRAICK